MLNNLVYLMLLLAFSLEGRFDDKELQDMLDEIITYRSIQS